MTGGLSFHRPLAIRRSARVMAVDGHDDVGGVDGDEFAAVDVAVAIARGALLR